MLTQGGAKSEVSAALSCQMASTHGPSCPSSSQLAFHAPDSPSRDKASERMGPDFITHQGKVLVTQTVKNLPATQEASGSIPGLGRSPGGGHGNIVQYCCLENSMDRGPWCATVQEYGGEELDMTE